MILSFERQSLPAAPFEASAVQRPARHTPRAAEPLHTPESPHTSRHALGRRIARPERIKGSFLWRICAWWQPVEDDRQIGGEGMACQLQPHDAPRIAVGHAAAKVEVFVEAWPAAVNRRVHFVPNRLWIAVVNLQGYSPLFAHAPAA